MKKIFFSVLFLASFCHAFSEKNAEADTVKTEKDAYYDMAVEISSTAANNGVKKTAVLSFSNALSSEAFKEGAVISERLITNLIKEGKLEITERSQLEKVLSELKLENSGLIEEKTAKEVGKVLGADAVIAGTFIKTTDGLAEINARLIRVEDAKVLGAFSRKVKIDWLIKDASKKEEAASGRRIRRFRE